MSPSVRCHVEREFGVLLTSGLWKFFDEDSELSLDRSIPW